MSFFLDTNTCIYFLKGLHGNIQKTLQTKKPQEIKIPAMVMAELLFGAEHSKRVKQNRETVINFLVPYEIVPFDATAAEMYARIRSQLASLGTPIGPNDLIVAAIVLAHQGTLVTNNQQEFKRVKRLRVTNWA